MNMLNSLILEGVVSGEPHLKETKKTIEIKKAKEA